jgi:hypothetical protein
VPGQKVEQYQEELRSTDMYDLVDYNKHELLVVKVKYGRDNVILNLKSINLTPQDASEFVKAVEVLALGYPQLHKLAQRENVVQT